MRKKFFEKKILGDNLWEKYQRSGVISQTKIGLVGQPGINNKTSVDDERLAAHDKMKAVSWADNILRSHVPLASLGTSTRVFFFFCYFMLIYQASLVKLL